MKKAVTAKRERREPAAKENQSLFETLKTGNASRSSIQVFEACSKCLECLCSEEFSLAGKCEVSKKTPIDASVIKLKQAVQDYSTKEDTPVKDKIFSLLTALKKIAAFYSFHDLSNWELWGDIFTVVKWAEEKASIPEEVIVTAIAASFIALKWFFYRLDNTKLSEDERISLSWKLALFMGSCYKFMCHESEKVKEAAYAINCELLVMFSPDPDLAKFNRLLKHTVSDEKLSVTALLLEFLQKKVFVEGNDDIQDKHKRRCLLNMFGNLVAYNIVDITLAAPYFKNYMKFNNDYGDIIEATIAKARETNNLKTAKTLGISLQQLFKELQVEHGDVDRLSDAFKSIKDLSGRFALFFTFDKIKNREAVATVHKDGIIFSLTPFENFNKGPNSAPPNLAFLEVLYEFTNKLIKQDKMTVVNYLDKLVEGKIPQERQEDWEPFYTYRNSLMQGIKEWNPFFLRQAEQEFYGIKNRQDASSDRRYEPHTPGPMSVQPMTSTPVKGHHHHEKDEDSNMESNIASEHDYDDS